MSTQKTTIYRYSFGFMLSIIFTLCAYCAVVYKLLAGWQLTALIVLLAIMQIIVQLVFFLHVGEKGKSTITTLVVTTASVVIVLVFGTIWIMNNLSYNMNHSQDIDNEIMRDELIDR